MRLYDRFSLRHFCATSLQKCATLRHFLEVMRQMGILVVTIIF